MLSQECAGRVVSVQSNLNVFSYGALPTRYGYIRLIQGFYIHIYVYNIYIYLYGKYICYVRLTCREHVGAMSTTTYQKFPETKGPKVGKWK